MPFLHIFLKWFRRLLLTIWFWTGAAIGTLLTTAFVGLVCMAFPRMLTHDFITFSIENLMAGFIELWMTVPGFWKIDLYYPSDLDVSLIASNKGPFILAANHNSIVDTLFIALLEYKKSYTYNRKYRYVPLFGQLCILAGYVDIDMSNPESKAKCTQRIGDMIDHGYSIMLYPEGTRNKTPCCGIDPTKLKSGAFRLSSTYGAKILPIKIVGSDQILRPYGIVDSGIVKIIISTPYVVAKEYDLDEERRRFADIINNTPTE